MQGMARTPTPLPVLGRFGRRLRSARLKAGLTQEQVAEAAGMHSTYVSSVERGERNVGLVNLLRLASAVSADPAALVKGLRA
jgi:transcriptional regulator with XRE-family HTH domain